jgi:GAF domain-containing protein
MIEAIRQAQATYISADDKRQAFEGLLDALLNVTGSAYGFIGEVIQDEQDQPAVRMHAITNIAWDEESRRAFDEQREAGMLFRNPDTLFGHALVSGEPVIANHPDSDPRRGGRPQGHPPLASFLGVPIKVGEEMVAMVGLANQPGGYSEADIEFLQPMLGAVRQLVLAWRAQTERRRTRRELQTARDLLAEKSEALQTTLDSISQGLVRVDAQARVTFYNQRLLELLDLPEELLRHHPPFSAVLQHQLDRGDFGAQFEWVEPSVRETMSALDWMATPDFYWRHTRDGRTLEVRTLRLPAGGMVRTFTDVTSYFKVQEDLRHQR